MLVTIFAWSVCEQFDQKAESICCNKRTLPLSCLLCFPQMQQPHFECIGFRFVLLAMDVVRNGKSFDEFDYGFFDNILYFILGREGIAETMLDSHLPYVFVTNIYS